MYLWFYVFMRICIVFNYAIMHLALPVLEIQDKA
jgi:hypothetical protein